MIFMRDKIAKIFKEALFGLVSAVVVFCCVVIAVFLLVEAAEVI